jgi:hypothetical protein
LLPGEDRRRLNEIADSLEAEAGDRPAPPEAGARPGGRLLAEA